MQRTLKKIIIGMNDVRTSGGKADWKSVLQTQLANYVRRAGSWSYGGYTWIVFTVLVLTFGALAKLNGRTKRARRLARIFARLMFKLAGMPLSATGLDRLPAQPHVLLLNHTSFLDALALTALLPDSPGYTFITRQEFPLQSMLCPLVRSVRTIVLEHHDETHHSGNVEKMHAALERGENLLVFPEGKFTPEPGVRPFHSGAFVAAAQANVPIVVAGLRGARSALRLGTWLPKRTALSLEIGPTLAQCAQDQEAIHACMVSARMAMIPLSGEAALNAPNAPAPSDRHR